MLCSIRAIASCDRPLVGLAHHLEVRDHDRHADLAADAEGFLQRIEDPVRLVAHVRAVDAAEFLSAGGRPRSLLRSVRRWRARRKARWKRRWRRLRAPRAPASRMRAICCFVRGLPAGRPCVPRAKWCGPTSSAQLVAAGLAFSCCDVSGEGREREPLAVLVQQVQRRRYRLRHGRGIGASEMPQLPATTVVMPWLTLGAMSGLDSISRSSWVWASMKPGAAIRPARSISVAAALRRRDRRCARCGRRECRCRRDNAARRCRRRCWRCESGCRSMSCIESLVGKSCRVTAARRARRSARWPPRGRRGSRPVRRRG